MRGRRWLYGIVLRGGEVRQQAGDQAERQQDCGRLSMRRQTPAKKLISVWHDNSLPLDVIDAQNVASTQI